MSSRFPLLDEDALKGAVVLGVVGGLVLPAVPDDVQPGAGQDACGVGVVVAACSGSGVEVGGPGVGVSGVDGEVDHGIAQLFVTGPAESDGAQFAGLAGRGCLREVVPVLVEVEVGGPPPEACRVVGLGCPPRHPWKGTAVSKYPSPAAASSASLVFPEQGSGRVDGRRGGCRLRPEGPSRR